MGSAASEPRTALNSAALVCEAVEPLDVSEEEEPPPLIVDGAVFEGNGLNEESVASEGAGDALRAMVEVEV